MSESVNNLMVPMHLDGLYVPEENSVEIVVPSADFSKLPYRLNNGLLNNSNDFLGSAISRKPFSGATQYLPKGMHLH